VVAVSQRVAKPDWPPLTPVEVILRDDVATHCVEVPVEMRSCPAVPEALVESRNSPESERLVAFRLDAVSPVVEALMMLARVEYKVFAVNAVEEPVESVVCPVTLRVPPIAALDDAVKPVVEAFPNVVCPVTLRVPPSTVLPDTVSAVAEAVARVACPVAVRLLV
jgi:hypothetical protein